MQKYATDEARRHLSYMRYCVQIQSNGVTSCSDLVEMPESHAFNLHAIVEQRTLPFRVFRASTSALLLQTTLVFLMLLLQCFLTLTASADKGLIDACALRPDCRHRFLIAVRRIHFDVLLNARSARAVSVTC